MGDLVVLGVIVFSCIFVLGISLDGLRKRVDTLEKEVKRLRNTRKRDL